MPIDPSQIGRYLGMLGGGGGPSPGTPMPGLGGNVVAGPGLAGGRPPPSPVGPNIGAATSPQPNMGNTHAAMEKVKTAVQLLEQSLPLIPMGMPLHTEIMTATTKLVKHLSDAASNPGTELQTLLNLARQRAQSAPMAALGRMMQPGAPPGGGGGGMPPAPGPPAMPPGGGEPAPAMGAAAA